jgi:hypothetical protein
MFSVRLHPSWTDPSRPKTRYSKWRSSPYRLAARLFLLSRSTRDCPQFGIRDLHSGCRLESNHISTCRLRSFSLVQFSSHCQSGEAITSRCSKDGAYGSGEMAVYRKGLGKRVLLFLFFPACGLEAKEQDGLKPKAVCEASPDEWDPSKSGNPAMRVAARPPPPQA